MTQNTIKSTFSFLSVTNSKKRVGCIEKGLNLQKLIRGSKPWLSAMERRGGSPLPGIRSHSTIWILVMQLNCLSLLPKSPVLKAVYRGELVFVLPHLKSLFPESLSRIFFLSVHLQKPILLSHSQIASLPHRKTLMCEAALDYHSLSSPRLDSNF